MVAGVRAMQQPSPSGSEESSPDQVDSRSSSDLDETFEVDLVQIATEDADKRWAEAIRLILMAANRDAE